MRLLGEMAGFEAAVIGSDEQDVLKSADS